MGVLAGTAVATATLVGALVVGDSVRHTLRLRSQARIGDVDFVLGSGDRFFRAALADELSGESGRLAPLVQLPAVVSSAGGDRRASDVSVLGVDERFFALSSAAARSGPARGALGEGQAWLSRELARRLDAEAGQEIVLRLERPSAIPRDMALAPEDVSVAVRLAVAGVVADEDFGRFALSAAPTPPANLFVSLAWLQGELDLEGRANLLLVDAAGELAEASRTLARDLRAHWTLTDAQLVIRTLASGERELASERIFLDDPIVEVLERSENLAGARLRALFTYFVNELRAGERATPYSMVTAVGALRAPLADPAWEPLVPADPGGIVLGEWVAGDLAAGPGDTVRLAYWVVDPSRALVERTRSFRVTGVVPLAGPAADPGLMPAFPGLADAENCRDWEPGTPVELDRIRPQDEAYWGDHRGTPKAFLDLAAGRAMWSSRFGALTAVRFPAADEPAVREALRAELAPAELGLFFRDVRSAAIAAGDSPTDFGGLFLGLSFFLILAALLLTTQLFLFGVEERASELGLYAALGFRVPSIRRLVLQEAGAVAVLGGVVGIPAGIAYTRAVLLGLRTVWSGAVAGLELEFDARATTVLLGVGLSLFATLLTVGIALRRRLRIAPARLLASRHGFDGLPAPVRAGTSLAIAGASFAVALLVVVLVDASSGAAAAGAFFAAGSAVLAGGLVLCRLLLRSPATSTGAVTSVARLGLANATRRPGRSLATIALIGIGTFLVVAVGANRQGPVRDVEARDSGTGGFAFYGRTTLPLLEDPGTPAGREAFALSDEALAGVSFVPLRVRDGDDASCLSLARPRSPRLLGVDASELARRGAFSFAGVLSGSTDAETAWSLLDETLDDGAVPAIGDTTSLTWQLKKGLGDTIEYEDERGRPFTVRIVGAIRDTVLQGDLVISGRRFEELYPTQGGYRRLLVDAPAGRVEAVRADLSRALEDVGLDLEGSGERLDAFHAVQNTYLAIFQLLGALGLLFGSAGLGMVVLRNTLERRGELALAAALGFTRRRIRRLLSWEYGLLLLCGLATGTAAAVVAILPAVRGAGSGGSFTKVLWLVALIAASGLLWILVAVRAVDSDAPRAALCEE